MSEDRAERNRLRVVSADIRRAKADAIALAARAWLSADDEDVVPLGEAVIVRGGALDLLAAVCGVVDDGPPARRAEVSVTIHERDGLRAVPVSIEPPLRWRA